MSLAQSTGHGRGQLCTFGRIVSSCGSLKIQVLSNTARDRPTIQEAVLMGRVMAEAAPVQDSKATKPDMAIKAIRATREVIIIRGVSNSNNGVIRVIRSS